MTKFIPKLIALDVETTGLEFYRKDFQILSLAASWYDENGKMFSVFYDDIRQMRPFLTRLSTLKIPLVTFNAGFELGCLKCVYPNLQFNFYCDVMRLAQVYDSGGPDKEFGLKSVVRRHLPERANYEEEIYTWVRENVDGVKLGKEGAHLAKAPKDILKRYNEADTETTLQLYKLFTNDFKRKGFDWTADHELYMSSVALLTQAKIEGIKVDVDKLKQCVVGTEVEVAAIDLGFRTLHAKEIEEVRELLRQKAQAKYKKKIVTELPEFNITSTQHLEFLFTKVLGQSARIKTKTGKPSFKSAHMGQWVGAELLANRGKRLIVQKQAIRLLEKAEYDGRYHVDLRLCATITGRAAGGNGLNIQAIARRDKSLMQCLVADEHMTIVSVDFSAGEPSVTSHYSQDYCYKYSTYDGIGKEPFWDKGVLMIDDTYLMFGTIAPFSAPTILKEWVEYRNEGRTFAEQWLVDPEVIKSHFKKLRTIVKMACLAFNYGLGARKFKLLMDEIGFNISLSDCKKCHKGYWELFSRVKGLSNDKARLLERDGFIMTELGFIVRPDASYKALNAFIQSTVASIIQLFALLLFKRAPWMKLQTQIHDELVIQVPTARLEEFKRAKELAAEDLNIELKESLGWTVPMRLGFVCGNNWYEAK